jgi:hypothetical protein
LKTRKKHWKTFYALVMGLLIHLRHVKRLVPLSYR